MSAKEMAPAIGLNIDQMRAEIYREMVVVCRPFYQRLEQLDHVEAFLKREQQRMNGKRSWETRKTKRRVKIVRHERVEPKAIASGTSSGSYAVMSQPKVITDIVSKEPGLSTKEITARMREGGYPFKSKEPASSIIVALGTMRKKGTIQQVRSEIPGEPNRYYPMDHALPEVAERESAEDMTTRIVNIIATSPQVGVTRKEVLDALLESGYVFPESPSPPYQHVTWALNGLAKRGRIHKSGSGTEALFSRPKVRAYKLKSV